MAKFQDLLSTSRKMAHDLEAHNASLEARAEELVRDSCILVFCKCLIILIVQERKKQATESQLQAKQEELAQYESVLSEQWEPTQARIGKLEELVLQKDSVIKDLEARLVKREKEFGEALLLHQKEKEALVAQFKSSPSSPSAALTTQLKEAVRNSFSSACLMLTCNWLYQQKDRDMWNAKFEAAYVSSQKPSLFNVIVLTNPVVIHLFSDRERVEKTKQIGEYMKLETILKKNTQEVVAATGAFVQAMFGELPPEFTAKMVNVAVTDSPSVLRDKLDLCLKSVRSFTSQLISFEKYVSPRCDGLRLRC